MTTTRTVGRILDAHAAITEAPEASPTDLAFMARQLVQATLPHSDPGEISVWKRTNGRLTLTIRPAFDDADRPLYPYGTVPRLLLFWMTTEAVRTGQRRLELGDSLAGFMREIGLDPSRGGKRSDATRLRNQMTRLFRATISFDEKLQDGDRAGARWLDMSVAPKGEMWWTPRALDQAALWGSWVELGEEFHKAITAAPVPVDMRALRGLQRSPMALDLYAWATYRAFTATQAGKPVVVAWRALGDQLGADYSNTADLKKSIQAALRKVRVVYPALRVESVAGGIKLLPSTTAIKARLKA